MLRWMLGCSRGVFCERFISAGNSGSRGVKIVAKIMPHATSKKKGPAAEGVALTICLEISKSWTSKTLSFRKRRVPQILESSLMRSSIHIKNMKWRCCTFQLNELRMKLIFSIEGIPPTTFRFPTLHQPTFGAEYKKAINQM